MITVLMQEHGGRDLLTPYLEKLVLKTPTTSWSFPETGKHPEDQIKDVNNWIKLQKTNPNINFVITTHSLLIIYALNNAMLKDPTLKVEAFKIKKSGKKVSAINSYLIDDAILGNAFEAAYAEFMAQLLLKGGFTS